MDSLRFWYARPIQLCPWLYCLPSQSIVRSLCERPRGEPLTIVELYYRLCSSLCKPFGAAIVVNSSMIGQALSSLSETPPGLVV